MIPKFKVWDKENKIMLAVNNICNLFWDSKFIEGYELVPDPKGKQEYDLIDHRIDFADAILMKSTGRFDNSTPKKEIFEGDIVELEYELTGHRSRYIITFESVWDTDNEFYFWSMREPCFNNLKPISYLYLASERVTVLGNIYENPELLREETKWKSKVLN